ncbi:MAG: hypothetical protein AAF202_11185, partial [Pseudomonadota bacterium]
MKFNAVLVFVSILVGVAIAEVVAQFSLDEFAVRHGPLSFEPGSALKTPGRKYTDSNRDPDGNLIFDKTYFSDQFGRRPTPLLYGVKRAHLFFGCSFVYGDGLDEEQTLPSLFSEATGIQAYNYGRGAGGPHWMLSLLSNTNIHDHMRDLYERVDVSFVAQLFHTKRYLGSMHWIGRFGTKDPYYDLEDGKLVDKETFLKGRFLTSLLYWTAWHSKLVR